MCVIVSELEVLFQFALSKNRQLLLDTLPKVLVVHQNTIGSCHIVDVEGFQVVLNDVRELVYLLQDFLREHVGPSLGKLEVFF